MCYNLLSYSRRHAPSLVRNNRFRKDPRAVEEDEEMWFDQDDESEDWESTQPMSDLLKHKLEADLDNIQKIWEHKKGWWWWLLLIILCRI